MALYNVKVQVEYTAQVAVDDVDSAEEAMALAEARAKALIHDAFENPDMGLGAVGKAEARSAVCVSGW